MNSIINNRKRFDIDVRILAYWLMFCRAPRNPEPDADGMCDLSEIGADAAKNWERLTPYSPAVKISRVKFQNETPQIAFVNDLEEPERQPDFW